LRAETYGRDKFLSSQRIFSKAEQAMVDAETLKSRISEIITENEKVVLFANRRGYSPVTVCQDCFRPVLCDKCDSPVVLHGKEKKENPFWLCHKCLRKIPLPEQCPDCKSWNLKEFGAGIRKIAEETKKNFPQAKIFIMDSDAVKTKKQGEEIMKNFTATAGAILIGTEIIFSFLRQPVDAVAVVSIDSLFTFPDFRINEKVFRLLAKLRSLAEKKFFLQTRMPELDIFSEVLRGNVSGFYKTELESRKKSGYPPFSLLIKITGENANKLKLKKETDELERKLKKWNPISYPSFVPKIRNKYIWNILLKIEPGTWPDNQKELRALLSSLPLFWKINVDPESLL
jgi:primosomal protein N' (replication factor Y)